VEQDSPQTGVGMMSWSNEQQRLLRAMGYLLYAQAPVATPTPADETAVAPAVDVSRLLRALQHAVLGRDVAALMVDTTALRGNPAAKRALWPKLRALRRPH
jgi:hypothetical protein